MPLLTEILSSYTGALSLEGNAESLPISLVTVDSRKVTQGALFVAVKGNKDDGSDYAIDAVAKGAVAIVTDHDTKLILPKSIVIIRVDNVRLALAKIASAFYSLQPPFIAAITGTDGKTSTADFFRQLWQMEYKKAASIGTLGVIGAKDEPIIGAINTTPDPVLLHQTMQDLAKEGYQYLALEASSHGLDQYRLDGVEIKAAAFTNLTRDHLDYHETIENYFKAKARLFSDILPNYGVAVLNADDAKYRRLKEICTERNIRIISYGFHGETYKIKKVTPTMSGLAVQANINGNPTHFMLNMVGSFQVMNCFAALGLFVGCGGDLDSGLKHLPHLNNVKGRVEKVANHPNGAPIFIDYAHTPAALGNVLKTMRPHVKGKLIVIFGCGGDRDKGKRPEMGKVASELADMVIITDDNPRNENPAQIRKEIMFATRGAKEIGDRAEAIAVAIKGLQSEDVLLVAGKGHETTQIIGDREIPFNDADAAKYAVKLCEERLR